MNKAILDTGGKASFKYIHYNEKAINFVKSEYNVLMYCYSGNAIIEINYKKYSITPRTTIQLTYQDVLMRLYVSKDFEGYCLVFSPELLIAEFNKLDFNFISALKRNCVVNWNEEYATYIENLFKTIIISQKFDDEDLTKGIILNQYICYIKFLKFYFQKFNMIAEKENDITSNKKGYFYSFIRELLTHYRQSREVHYYANILNISSNYLNEVCQSTCKHSAKEIIDNYLSSQLKLELNSTNKSIQELTEEYNFPNQSYFSRYYRRMMGETPSDTRKNKTSDTFTIF